VSLENAPDGIARLYIQLFPLGETWTKAGPTWFQIPGFNAESSIKNRDNSETPTPLFSMLTVMHIGLDSKCDGGFMSVMSNFVPSKIMVPDVVAGFIGLAV
jgi:hypothetical protein